MFNIEPFLQYGVLGVIGYIYLKVSKGLFEKQSSQFELLMNNLVQEKSDSFDELKDLSAALLQTQNNQSKYITQLFNDLSTKLNSEYSDKQNLLTLFLKQDERSIKQNMEFTALLSEYKMIIYEMRINCSCLNKRRIGNILVEKGMISQEQLDCVVNEQRAEFLRQLG